MIVKKRKVIILSVILLSLILLFLLVIPFGISVMIYEDNFGSRYETYAPMSRSIEEFEGLQLENFTFPSNKGQMLAGYKYYKELQNNKGVIILAHGLGGGGHNSYMDIADYFTSNGYVVFAYDATGNDESEGQSVKGLPQGVIDLNYAIEFVKEEPEFEDLPIMLFGHSWGGYSVGSVLNQEPDIKAAVIVAGFNNSLDMIEEEGKKIAGEAINYLLPYISLYEKIKFGKYASYSCISGFENTDTGVMILHSTDDKMISQKNSYDIFYELYKTNSRFHFVKFDNRGHDYVYYSDQSLEYKDDFNRKFDAYVNSLDGELTAQLKADYLNEHLDKKLLYSFDEELMDRILKFYDSYVN